MTTNNSLLIYRINHRDEIVFVNDEWDSFAVANAGEAVTSAQVLQRPIWSFISDQTTRELYRQMLTRVRGGSSLQFSFRCDSPTCRRLLEMKVNPLEKGAVEFVTRTLWAEERPAPALLEPGAARSDAWLRMCSWCEKVWSGEAWAEIEDAIADSRLFEQPLMPSMTHAICELCRHKMMDTLGKA